VTASFFSGLKKENRKMEGLLHIMGRGSTLHASAPSAELESLNRPKKGVSSKAKFFWDKRVVRWVGTDRAAVRGGLVT